MADTSDGEVETVIGNTEAYTAALFIDGVIIVAVSTRKFAASPMYLFIKNFLCSEMLLVTLVVPNMLRVIWLNGATISIPCCIAQSYLYCASGSTESYLLSAMAYDRYLAICKPLLYNKIMSQNLQHSLVIFCWVLGFMSTLITMGFVTQLKFCGPNIIDHYFCDLAPFVDLACSDTSSFEMEILILSFPIMVIPFILVLVSYSCVVITILRMSSITGRKKAFSTCSSHLSVVTIYFGSLIIIYLIPSSSQTLNKIVSVLYTVVTPLFNPFIYTIRNKEIRAVIRKWNNYLTANT
ncbi:olfactory receptor-like protein HbT3 [Rana temporaria]|uniref:olfactory receptor-like protein HbT3 n=1 Tax=Rana temporaria TaxID=8407 RepID=UPI001AAC56D0|nr:olfactory receptor-like protein HbT3 [Rana temporaria]